MADLHIVEDGAVIVEDGIIRAVGRSADVLAGVDTDGFEVLDALRSKQETANIPVIVATAKELTVDEKSRLQGQIQSLMLKGDFLNDEFLDEVRSLIK